MLAELTIRNFALIDSLTIEFSEGLNVLSGETGAGKSIVMDAIGLLLGDKAGAGVVKKGAERCQVTGRFAVPKKSPALRFLDELSIELEDDLIIRRDIDASGKSKAFVNDQPVSLASLSNLGDFLIDVHGQHDHQLLMKSGEQRELLDRFGAHEALQRSVAELYSQWNGFKQALENSQVSEQERNAKVELLEFQTKEIGAARLKIGEEEEIEALLPQLKNADKLRTLSGEIRSHLTETDGSALERLRKTKKLLESMQAMGIALGEGPSWIEDSIIKTQETADWVDRFADGLSADPGKLDASLSRLDQISKLKRKYGTTLAEILEYYEAKRSELDRMKNYEGSQEAMKENLEKARAQLMAVAKKLSAARRRAGEELAASVQKELKDLGFLKARFDVQWIEEKDAEGAAVPTAHGLERAEFQFSANPGEDLKPLKSVASGGELSRIMLALKKILAQSDVVSTLIFDEIDTGVGGSMGHVLGQKLKGLSKSHQILLITHLPQIAAFAERQFSVRKGAVGNKTEVAVETLEKETRVQEIARMLGGITGKSEKPSDIALKHATELLSINQ